MIDSEYCFNRGSTYKMKLHVNKIWGGGVLIPQKTKITFHPCQSILTERLVRSVTYVTIFLNNTLLCLLLDNRLSDYCKVNKPLNFTNSIDGNTVTASAVGLTLPLAPPAQKSPATTRLDTTFGLLPTPSAPRCSYFTTPSTRPLHRGIRIGLKYWGLTTVKLN